MSNSPATLQKGADMKKWKNENLIYTKGFSNPSSAHLYQNNFNNHPKLIKMYTEGTQCGGCSFFAPFNEDYSLCCYKKLEHFRETVFEHFTCLKCCYEGWETHRFNETQK